MDWSSNLVGVKKLLDGADGQLAEGPGGTPVTEASKGDGQTSAMPPPPPPPPANNNSSTFTMRKEG
jgi:hypothetical protein